MLKRIITLIQLIIGVLLPWKLRCLYSLFLVKLERQDKIHLVYLKSTDVQRSQRIFLLWGNYYFKKGKFELSAENLKKALETNPSTGNRLFIYSLLSKCYKHEQKINNYVESAVNYYKNLKNKKSKNDV